MNQARQSDRVSIIGPMLAIARNTFREAPRNKILYSLLFFAVLHFVRRELATEVLKQFRRSLPPGSYVAISTACSDGMDAALIDRLEAVYSRSPVPLVLRSTSQVGQLFEGLELLEPGLVDVTEWRDVATPLPIRILAGVGKAT